MRQRLLVSLLVVGAIAAWMRPASNAVSVLDRAQDEADKLLRTAREAVRLGAKDRKIAAMVLQGTVLSGFDGVTGKLMSEPSSLEIRILFPDAYLRIVSVWQVLQRSGFIGDVLLNEWRPLDPAVHVATAFTQDEIKAERREFGMLILGMLAETRAAFPLGIAPPAEPKPGPQSVGLIGPDGFLAVLDLDERSGLPARLRYQGRLVFPRPITAAEKRAGIVPPPSKAEDVEVVLTFDDRRVVDGLSLPFRIRRTARDVTFEDMRFEKILVNPSLTVKDFK